MVTGSLGAGKLEGLAAYMSRLLRAVWDWTITTHTPNGNADYLTLRFSRAQLLALQGPLLRLQAFVEQSFVFTTASGRNQEQIRVRSRPSLPACFYRLHGKQQEQDHLRDLRALLDMSVEAFAFLLVLAEQDNFPKIVSRYSLMATVIISSELYVCVCVSSSCFCEKIG